jgi:hypothetical protein
LDLWGESLSKLIGLMGRQFKRIAWAYVRKVLRELLGLIGRKLK